MSNSIYPFSNLTGGIDDSYLDYFDGDDLVDGDFAFGIDDGMTYMAYRLDAISGEADNPPFIVSPATNPGTKRWILATPAAPLTCLRVSSSATSIADNAPSKVIHPTSNFDLLSEYNTTTGIFTPIYSGFYNISLGLKLSTASFAAGDRFRLVLSIGAIDIMWSSEWLCQVAGTYEANLILSCGCLYISGGSSVEFYAFQDSGAAIALTGEEYDNWLSINRIL